MNLEQWLGRRGVRTLLLPILLLACSGGAEANSGISAAPVIDKPGKLRQATFLDNRDEHWYVNNVPFLDTPDRVIDDTFLYRFDMMTKHFVYGSPRDGYAVTEFIDKPDWSGKYGAIACPLGFQFAELRWLRDQRVARDYARYWLHVPGAQPRRYTNWFAAAMWGLYEAWGDRAFILSMLPDMRAQYAGWERERWDPRFGMFVWDGMQDGMETNINSRQTDKIYFGDDAVRPTFSSYMFADARAIANTARLAGDNTTAADFDRRAAAIKAGVQRMLWDPKRRFFFPMAARDQALADKLPGKIRAGSLTYQSGPHAGDTHGRELLGLVPWQFNLPDAGYEDAWRGIKDFDVFAAPFGPTTTERHDPLFKLTDECCTWSGNSWPFATAQTLAAMANLLNNYSQSVVDRKDYYNLLRNFSLTQRRDGVPFVAEAANPDTGAWQVTPGHSEHYFHSSYVDLIITGLIGLRPSAEDRVVINPLVPREWDWFALEDVPYHGRRVTILWDRDGRHYRRGKGLSLIVDGRLAARSDGIGRLEVLLSRAPAPPIETAANFAVNHDKDGFPSITANHSSPNAPITAANDGLRWYAKAPPNRWTTEGSGPGDVTVELDLGAVRPLERLRLFLIDDGPGAPVRAPIGLRVQYRRNGSGWRGAPLAAAVGSLRGSRPTDIRFAKLLSARRVRLTFRRTPGTDVGLTELEAWGPGMRS